MLSGLQNPDGIRYSRLFIITCHRNFIVYFHDARTSNFDVKRKVTRLVTSIRDPEENRDMAFNVMRNGNMVGGVTKNGYRQLLDLRVRVAKEVDHQAAN